MYNLLSLWIDPKKKSFVILSPLFLQLSVIGNFIQHLYDSQGCILLESEALPLRFYKNRVHSLNKFLQKEKVFYELTILYDPVVKYSTPVKYLY